LYRHVCRIFYLRNKTFSSHENLFQRYKVKILYSSPQNREPKARGGGEDSSGDEAVDRAADLSDHDGVGGNDFENMMQKKRQENKRYRWSWGHSVHSGVVGS
jgi:hypothetical protein